MMSSFKNVTVIGAGVMGARIAAHLCNAGISTNLLDIVPDKNKNKNIVSENALKVMLKEEPAPFMSKKASKLLNIGNLEDNLNFIEKSDWVIEAIVENLDIKKNLYSKISEKIPNDCIVSSNTSTIPLVELTDGMNKKLIPNFMITHFFNPPRYMRLLEIIASEFTRDDLKEKIQNFCDQKLGKSVIIAKDTPGFIANRIGTFWYQLGIKSTLEYNLSVEEADILSSLPFGVPKSGIFGTLDLVGLDLMPHVAASMLKRLPKNDKFRDIFSEPKIIKEMLDKGWIGRKGPSGFYRLNKKNNSRIKESIDLKSGKYSKSEKIKLESKDLKEIIEDNNNYSKFVWSLLSQAIPYAVSLVPEISEEIIDIDIAMKDGYGWKYGPFEIIDIVGAKWLLEKLREDNIQIPNLLELAATNEGFYRVKDGVTQYLSSHNSYKDIPSKKGVIKLSNIKITQQPILKNHSASVWDIGDKVLCFEFTSKMNSLDPLVMEMYKKTISFINKSEDYNALVIYNEDNNFSVGANLALFLFAANIAMWNEIESQISEGQKTYQALKKAPFPVVSAPSGLALGGGCEILLHSDAIQAHSETYTGLVEAGVGIIPGWGGCKEIISRLRRNTKIPGGPMPFLMKAFELIGTAKVAKSAFEAKELGFFSKDDEVTMNRDRLLFDAKQKAMRLSINYIPPESEEFSLPGKTGYSTLQLAINDLSKKGQITEHDKVVAGALAEVLTGGDTDITESLSEDDLLKLERKVFLKLSKTTSTLARMEHMLNTGKPLRN